MSYQVQGNNIIDNNGNINAGIITATQYNGNVVTRILAGAGILVQPSTGIGEVTIINTGGGGGGGGGAPGIIQMDNIASQFNGVQTQFAILIAGTNPQPLPTTGGVIIAVDGVVQTPYDSYQVATIGGVAYLQFSQAPTAGMQFSGYVIDLQVATSTVPGVVKPDNSTIIVSADGTLTVVGGGGTSTGGGPTNLIQIDDISPYFNGTSNTFSVKIAGQNPSTTLSNGNVLLSVGGVVQVPSQSFNIVGAGASSNIVFTQAPTSGLSFVGYIGLGGTAGGGTAGVSQIVAGTGVSISPSGGTGVVTINATGGGGSGTVTSVNIDGGTSGLVFSGGPITTSGTITVTGGTLGTAFGGTGTTTGAVTQVIAGAGLTASAAGSAITLALDISTLPALP